jgi:carboxyl-terminal processing protease
MKGINKFWILLCLALGFWACEDQLLTEKYYDTPLHNYEMFWSEFDLFYGAFEAKGIPWDSLKGVYSTGLTNSSTNRQLFIALSGLLHALDDGHASLDAPGLGYFRSWNRRSKSYFGDIRNYDYSNILLLQEVIKKRYISNAKSTSFSGYDFFWGPISFGTIRVGYIYIPTFSISDYPKAYVQQAVESFKTLDAVIVDLRFNGGGTTEAFYATLNLFASESRVYLKSKLRNGPGHNDFTAMEEHATHPNPDGIRNKPIAVLMNAYSASSSDHFILGMKSQPNVITVGDTTCGAFSSVLERVMPNGWVFRLGAQVVYAPDGNLLTDIHGKYLEGIGIAPDFYAPDELKEIDRGNDITLNKALWELNRMLKN